MTFRLFKPETRLMLGLPAESRRDRLAALRRSEADLIDPSTGYVRAGISWSDGWERIERIDAMRADLGLDPLTVRFEPTPFDEEETPCN